MEDDDEMQDADLEHPIHDVIKFGEAKLATADARAAAIAHGHVQMHDAETLELPEASFSATVSQTFSVPAAKGAKRICQDLHAHS